MSHLPEHLQKLKNESVTKELTLDEVMNILGDEGHYLFILFFILPFLQPIPLYGLSTPVGIAMIFVALFLFQHRAPYLPNKIKAMIVKKEILDNIFKVLEKLFLWSHRIHRERMTYFIDVKVFHKLNATLIALNAFLLALPLPIPFSNTVPAVSILLLTVGSIQKDGLFIIFSYIWHFSVVYFFWQLLLLIYQFLQSQQILT